MNQSGGFWIIVLVVVGVAMLLNAIGGNSNSTATPTADRSSFEHRYATERLKQEGYNSREAQQAADAIIKFHNAQKRK